MKVASYFRVASHTTLNIILYAATTGKYLWLEGRVRRGVFRNWARRFKYAPITYAEPSSEEEILQILRSSARCECSARATPSTKEMSATRSSYPWITTVVSYQKI